MAETLTAEVLPQLYNPEALKQQRDAFVENMVNTGVMSEEFAKSGVLDRFAYDVPHEVDSLMHILVGDKTGGLHHLRTVMDLGVEDREVSSELYDANRPDRGVSSFKKEQKVLSSGVYGANNVAIIVDGIRYRKLTTSDDKDISSGSNMFPNEWTAQDVLAAVLQVADEPPIEGANNGLPTQIHDGHVNDVRIRVITDKANGEILTAFPMHRGRYLH